MIFLIGGEKMIVETAYGKLKGIQENDVYVWKGIPYADQLVPTAFVHQRVSKAGMA